MYVYRSLVIGGRPVFIRVCWYARAECSTRPSLKYTNGVSCRWPVSHDSRISTQHSVVNPALFLLLYSLRSVFDQFGREYRSTKSAGFTTECCVLIRES